MSALLSFSLPSHAVLLMPQPVACLLVKKHGLAFLIILVVIWYAAPSLVSVYSCCLYLSKDKLFCWPKAIIPYIDLCGMLHPKLTVLWHCGFSRINGKFLQKLNLLLCYDFDGRRRHCVPLRNWDLTASAAGRIRASPSFFVLFCFPLWLPTCVWRSDHFQACSHVCLSHFLSLLQHGSGSIELPALPCTRLICRVSALRNASASLGLSCTSGCANFMDHVSGRMDG